MKVQIELDEWYSPREISDMTGVMTAKTKNTRRQMVLRFIRDGKIKAKNVGTESKPRYLVRGLDLKEYINYGK